MAPTGGFALEIACADVCVLQNEIIKNVGSKSATKLKRFPPPPPIEDIFSYSAFSFLKSKSEHSQALTCGKIAHSKTSFYSSEFFFLNETKY